MERWTRREVLKLGALASTVAVSPKWIEASTDRNVALNRAAWASSSADFINTGHMATDGLAATKWQSADADLQWIYVDLGAECNIRSVVLRWGGNFAVSHKVQVSTESGASPETGLVENWTDVHQTLEGKGGVEQIPLPATSARYVRLLLDGKAKAGGYELNSFEVFGTGGFEAVPMPMPAADADGNLKLSGGWRLVNQATLADKAGAVSTCGYDDSKWLIATVPGTILTSYLNLGAVPDPFYGDWDYQISEFFAYTNWWYRNELEVPASYAGKRVWLNFAGINYRAYVYVNGKSVGAIDGAFIRSKFDVTELVTPGKKNCIAVLIAPVPKPDKMFPKPLDGYVYPIEYPKNEPTILEADSWDWLPTIHDRDTGIINHMTLTASGDVTVENPMASSHFPEKGNLKRADVTLRVEVKNHAAKAVKGELRVKLGEVQFSYPVTLDAKECREIKLDKSNFKQLSLVEPKLWWPNGHGEQNLYDLTIEFAIGGKTSDVNRSRVGIREFTYSHDPLTDWNLSKIHDHAGQMETTNPKPLEVSCNGKRIFMRGADWGMDEGMLRCDRTGFEDRVRFEKDMNYNLIRNCLGNVDKEEFYDVCDEMGVMVWEEFGIHATIMPDDPAMWLKNARDRFLRRRNHACVVVWVTSNEGIPQDPMLTEMPKYAATLDGTRLHFHSSTQTPPSDGDGPYDSRHPSYYFKVLAHGFRTEMGVPTIPAVESMRRMMPWNKLWPIGQLWSDHDWWLNHGWGDEGLCDATQRALKIFGAPTGIEDCCRKAQMLNMEAFKAIYEAWNHRMWNDCTGVMIWMSNPAWPSLTWNTYDYYLDTTSAYYGIKKACEPVHIQWNIANNEVKAINCTSDDLNGLSAEVTIYSLDGSIFQTRTAKADCAANNTILCMTLFDAGEDKQEKLTEVHFIRLVLKDAGGKLLSQNFYWRSKQDWKYQDLAKMPAAKVNGTVSELKNGKLTVTLENAAAGLALMVRLKAVELATGLIAAPVLYSDNYVSLVSGESRKIEIDFAHVHTHGAVKLMMEGWNVEPAELAKSILV
jgi:hypothetical protein